MTENPVPLRSIIRREIAIQAATVTVGVGLHILVGRSPDGSAGIGLGEAIYLALVLVTTMRIVLSVRSSIRKLPQSPVDAVPRQPTEPHTGPATANCPGRVLEIEGMIRSALVDEEYFRSKFRPYFDALHTDGQNQLEFNRPDPGIRGYLKRKQIRRDNLKKLISILTDADDISTPKEKR